MQVPCRTGRFGDKPVIPRCPGRARHAGAPEGGVSRTVRVRQARRRRLAARTGYVPGRSRTTRVPQFPYACTIANSTIGLPAAQGVASAPGRSARTVARPLIR
ncbi:hypothetical protein GEM_0127 [Burkholderia cepacia GG4]|uniref:Uncharacterized protein n=1 Tax=Burkholderia cepacia GG4 TaxID=1009846 RepID=A0A9W3JWE5_BURCE|nr:hypothetical protein GEM_0127 [Burkholderia cepacia GG4]